MNTKILMAFSAVFLGLIGLMLSFLPQEIMAYFGMAYNSITGLFLQMMGAIYIGFAFLNWYVKGSHIGGIYNKPIALGNQLHFAVSAIALLNLVFQNPSHPEIIIPLTAVYTALALAFTYVIRTTPTKE